MRLRVYASDGTVEHPLKGFTAVYYKPANGRQLVLKKCTNTDDYELLSQVWEAANDMARKLGWIV
jgi:hypothetical protein